MTGQQTCEVIVYALGLNIHPRELWDASPTGELWHVWALQDEADKELAKAGLAPRK